MLEMSRISVFSSPIDSLDDLININGISGFICSNKFFQAKYGVGLREFLSSSKTFSNSTDYILGQGTWQGKSVYTDDETKLTSSYLDPNMYLGLYPKFTNMVFNGIVKWNYMTGSNFYFVYSSNKAVNGILFSGIEGLADFLQFNNKRRWVEVLRDQTIMIKIDYWFEN